MRVLSAMVKLPVPESKMFGGNGLRVQGLGFKIVSLNWADQYIPLYTIALLLGTPKKTPYCEKPSSY